MQGVFGAQLRGMVLCAGYGTRLGGLSAERPKPLLPVCDYPLVRYALALLSGHGIEQVTINLHHMGEMIEAELGDGHKFGMDLRYSWEHEILGTGGGIRRVAAHLTHNGHEPCVVVNGKILVDVDLESVLALHRITGAVATMVLKETSESDRQGLVEVGRDGRVQRIRGVDGPPIHRRERLTRCVFTGVQILEPSFLARLPHAPACVVKDGYLPALRDGDVISGYVIPGYFHEHSTPYRYLQGNINALRGLPKLRHVPGNLTGVAPTAELRRGSEIRGVVRIGEEAVIGEGAVIGPDVVIGRGVTVAPGVRLEKVVVFPGAHVSSSHTSTIVTTRAVYPVSEKDDREEKMDGRQTG